MISMNLLMSHNLTGILIAFIDSTLDYNSHNSLVLTCNLRYSIYVCPDNDLSALNFYPVCESLCKDFPKAFIFYFEFFLVISSMSSIYTFTMPNLLNSPDIFPGRYLVCCRTQPAVFDTHDFPRVVQLYRAV